MSALTLAKPNLNNNSFRSSGSNRPASQSQPANNVQRFPATPERERITTNTRQQRNLYNPQAQGKPLGNLGDSGRRVLPTANPRQRMLDAKAAREAQEATRQQLLDRARSLSEGRTRRFPLPKQGGLPQPIRPPFPKTNFPIRLPRLNIPKLGGVPQEIAKQLLFPDALNEGEDEFLKNLPKEEEPEFRPFEYPTEEGINYYAYVATHNARTEVGKIVYQDPGFGGEPWQYGWLGGAVPGQILGVRKRQPYSELLRGPGGARKYSGYKDLEILSSGYNPQLAPHNDRKVTRIVSSGNGSFDAALILALIPIGFPLPTITPDGELELPDDGEIIIIGGGSGLEMEPPTKDPGTGIKRKPRWRLDPPGTPTPTPTPKPPWRDWDDPERPRKIPIQDPTTFPKITFPTIQIPLPPFQEFRYPEPVEKPPDEECKNGGDCMSCQFNPAVIQRIVESDGTKSRTQDNANKVIIVEEIISVKSSFASLGTKMDNLLTRMNERFTKLSKMMHVDKFIQLITLATVLHNAYQLSSSAVQGIAELMSQCLSIVGIKDEDGSAINISQLVSAGIQGLLEGVIGAEKFKELKENYARANRIFQASTNILQNVRTLFATTQELIIWTADNTGKIGNALKRDGVVTESAYPWMMENNGKAGALGGLINFAETTANTTSSLTQVTGNVLTLQEETKQIKDNMKGIRDEVEKDTTTKDKKEEEKKPTVKGADGKSVTGADGEAVPNALGTQIKTLEQSDTMKNEPFGENLG